MPEEEALTLPCRVKSAVAVGVSAAVALIVGEADTAGDSVTEALNVGAPVRDASAEGEAVVSGECVPVGEEETVRPAVPVGPAPVPVTVGVAEAGAD